MPANKMSDSDNNNATEEELLKELQALKDNEKQIDKEIHELESKGVKESDTTDVINAIHALKDMKDTVSTVFEVLGQLTETSCAELYAKYKIPID